MKKLDNKSDIVNHLVPTDIALPSENWKRVNHPHYHQKYLISDHGRVFNLEQLVLVSQQLTGKPQYLYVNMHVKGVKRKLIRVHRLVAMSWLPYDEGSKYIVDHKDRNKLNNHISNLRLVDRRLNANNNHRVVYVNYKGFYIPISYALDIAILCGFKVKDYKMCLSQLNTYLKKGLDFEESLCRYKQIGAPENTKTLQIVLPTGESKNLYLWCKELGLDYSLIRKRVGNGWTSSEILQGFRISHKKGVEAGNMWFPSLDSFYASCKVSYNVARMKINEGMSYDELLNFTIDDKYKEDIVLHSGERLTVTQHELAQLTGRGETYIAQLIRQKDLNFQKVYDLPRNRIIKHCINGVVKRNSQWAKHFNIDPLKLNAYICRGGHNRPRRTFKQALDFYGVDTSGMEITPV